MSQGNDEARNEVPERANEVPQGASQVPEGANDRRSAAGPPPVAATPDRAPGPLRRWVGSRPLQLLLVGLLGLVLGLCLAGGALLALTAFGHHGPFGDRDHRPGHSRFDDGRRDRLGPGDQPNREHPERR